LAFFNGALFFFYSHKNSNESETACSVSQQGNESIPWMCAYIGNRSIGSKLEQEANGL